MEENKMEEGLLPNPAGAERPAAPHDAKKKKDADPSCQNKVLASIAVAFAVFIPLWFFILGDSTNDDDENKKDDDDEHHHGDETDDLAGGNHGACSMDHTTKVVCVSILSVVCLVYAAVLMRETYWHLFHKCEQRVGGHPGMCGSIEAAILVGCIVLLLLGKPIPAAPCWAHGMTEWVHLVAALGCLLVSPCFIRQLFAWHQRSVHDELDEQNTTRDKQHSIVTGQLDAQNARLDDLMADVRRLHVQLAARQQNDRLAEQLAAAVGPLLRELQNDNTWFKRRAVAYYHGHVAELQGALHAVAPNSTRGGESGESDTYRDLRANLGDLKMFLEEKIDEWQRENTGGMAGVV